MQSATEDGRTVASGAVFLSPGLILQRPTFLADPDWLRERRLRAARVYEALPVPRWQRGIRSWWTTDISALRLGEIGANAPVLASARPKVSALAKNVGQQAGLLVQQDAAVSVSQLDAVLAEKGVVFCALDEAARERPELVRPHLGGLARSDEDKFLALHDALWTGGVLVYVPAGVHVTLPLHARFRLERPQTGLFVHTLLVAEAGSRVTYVEEYSSPSFVGQGLHSGVVEVYAKDGAQVRVVTIHNWGDGVFDFSHKRARVDRDAKLQWVIGYLGGSLTRAAVETHLRAPGAEVEALGIFFGSGSQHLDLDSRTFHEAAHTSADVAFRGVVKDSAKAALEGLIRVEKGAQQTTSYLSDHTLQLSREAKSDLVPSLEIEANDVKVSHGATVGMLDEEQLFYLMSRGLPRSDAERMIVTGFFDPVLQRIPIEGVRRELLECIERKVGA